MESKNTPVLAPFCCLESASGAINVKHRWDSDPCFMSPHPHPLFKKLNAKSGRAAHVKDAHNTKVIHFNVAWIAPYKVDIKEGKKKKSFQNGHC